MNGLMLSGVKCLPHDSPLDNSLVKRQAKLPCFLAPNRHEIMVMGKKLVGSAQKRTSRAVLQHGSIPVTRAFRLLPRYLQLTIEERSRQEELLEQKTICIREINPALLQKDLIGSLVKGFCDTLGLQSIAGSWSVPEIQAIEAIAGTADFIAKWQT